MAAESSRSSTSSADSYIGSLISLTSKSEIRYEGILYNINTDESSIGLRNVRSFGSEGRKKDGPQIMPSDKVYEYILFRGSDIKDLQVKSSPPVQSTQSINSDPAIIQSHYPRPSLTSSSLPPIPGPQLGHPGSTFQGGMPLYQPGGSMGSWAPSPSPPNADTSGLAMPMYWPGFYAPSNGLPQLHQQSSYRPTPGITMSPSMQYPSFNTSTNLANLASTPLPSGLPPVPPSVLATEPLPNFMQTKAPNSAATSPDVAIPPISNKSNVLSGQAEPPTPSLVTPEQLLQSGQAAVVLSQSSLTVDKDVEQAPSLEQSLPVSASTEVQPPILPLPLQSRVAPKANGVPYQNRHYNNSRGRERGRGSGGSRPVMKFTEEFDFTAMNEKFNKDEVWGALGRSNKSSSKLKNGSNASDDDESEDKNDADIPKLNVKPVYMKDDFFDTLSCNSHDNNQSNNGRTRFSQQMKLDTETFGEFSRYRGGRGGRSRGGGFHGRGYGYGYGYVRRGRGGGGRNPTRDY